MLLIVISMTDDHSSESSGDNKSKEEHSGDDSKESDKKKEKEKKEKNKKDDDYDYDEDSQLTAQSIDEMFLGKPTEKPEKESEEHAEKTTIEPPQGVFGPNYLNNLANAGSSATTASSNTDKDENESQNESEDHQGSHSSNGNPFFPYPRPIDIWDRLFVLAAFPICFFAVMLKAEMFR
uniref:BatA domain-containing protein n=1 Tax=Caenorhabditis tropicalis TaxID=1561998 RepID=A0A1I7TX79_9PELO